MKLIIGCAFVLGCLAVSVADAQSGVWDRTPAIAVIGSDDDFRMVLVDEAVSFWNKTLEELGSGFRLGAVMHVARPIPEEALRSLSRSVVDPSRGPVYVPQVLRNMPGDLTIFLGASEFVSFASPFDADSKRIVGIRGTEFPPLNRPNVARNVIAHELGHAIGLAHNSDSSTLMCGRPAACRPRIFESDAARLFPLTGDEKRLLLALYPAGWKPRSR